MGFDLAALVLVALLCGFGAPAHAADDGVAPLHITEALFLESDAVLPPDAGAPWIPVRLEEAAPRRPAAARYGWLRIELAALPASLQGRPLALYLPSLRRAVAIFANGREVAATGTPALNRRLLCCAVYVELPAGALAGPGPHRLDIRLASIPGRYVAWNPVTLGDPVALWTAYETRLMAAGAGPLVALVLAIVASTVCLGLWMRRRQERQLLIFGLCAGMYVLSAGPTLWISTGEWSRLAIVVSGTADFASVALMLVFLLRHAGWRWPRAEAALWTWVTLSAGVQLFDDFYDWGSPWHAWWFTGIALDIAAVPLAAVIALRRRDRWSALLLGGTVFSAGLIGLQVVTDHISSAGLYLWPYYQLGPYAVITAMLMDRLVRALGESERLNAELEQRVDERGRALQAQHVQLRALEREQAVAGERQRLMSDMHDGIGAALIGTLSMVEAGHASTAQVAAALRDCIDDLRLAIDSLEPADGELAPVLGGLRYRLEPRLKAAGIKLDWQVSELPALPDLTPAAVLSILRLVQEAFTNVVKHARARTITLRARVEEEAGCVAIQVQDDGEGFDPAAGPAGRGMRNMARRAAAVGGAFAVNASPSGTTVELRLPLRLAGAQPA